MRPPAFWSNPPERPGWAARLLAPAAALVARRTARRVARGGGHAASVPVLCVGNLVLGGAGKTPTAIAVLERLGARGVAAHAVSRGYGGSEAGPVRVDPARHGAAEVGDEPLLLAAFGPAWVARDRAAGARAAEAAGAELLVLDDGFQGAGVAIDRALVVADAAAGFGNGRVAPAGPLREPVAAGLARADALLAIGDAASRARFLDACGDAIAAVPVLEGRLEPLRTGIDLAGARVLAFAGIARPEKFFETLRGLGAELAGTRALDDHQPLPAALVRRLEAEAAALGAQLVTTEKDAARLPAEFRGRVLAVPVRLELEDWAPLDRMLDGMLAAPAGA